MRLFDAPMISGPLSAGMPAYWLPGTTFISAILDPPALGALLRLSPGELRNAPVPLAWALPALPVEQVQEQLLAAAGPAGWVQVLSAWLLALADRGEQRWRGSFRLPQQWLFQPAPEIARQCGVGVRQLERRFLAAYGQSLRDSRRMARYERALGLLIADPLRRRGALTRVAMDAGYHDQAHMVRDFVDYLGLPPGSLLAGPEHGELRLLRYDAASRAVLLAGR
jgi:AraC-like DNA-binding protein